MDKRLTRTKKDNIEAIHQRLFFSKLSILYHEKIIDENAWILTFAVPNGGKRDIVTARNLKLEGVKPGVPDIFCDIPRGGYHGLRIELKKPIVLGESRPVVTKEQKDKINRYNRLGYLAKVCYGYQEAINVYLDYLGLYSR